jgi:hypothetical protein
MLLEYRHEPHLGSPDGWRVGEDGRVDHLSDRIEHVAGGRIVGRPAELAWREWFRIDAAGLEDLRTAIGATLARVHHDRYGTPEDAARYGRTVWHLSGEEGVREIAVEGFPRVREPALDELLQTLLRARTRGEGPVSTVWTWREDGTEHRREYAGEPALVDALAPLLTAVLPTGGDRSRETLASGSHPPFGQHEVGEPSPQGPALLEVQWRIGGQDGERITIYPDGRRLLHTEHGERETEPLDEYALAELRERLPSLGG